MSLLNDNKGYCALLKIYVFYVTPIILELTEYCHNMTATWLLWYVPI